MIIERLRAAGCVFAEDEARLLIAEAGNPDELEAMIDRRVAGEPLEHVLGWAEFRGLRIAVGPGVFVPRRRTGFLVERAVMLAPAVAVDLCCGSGAIGAALAAEGVGIEVYAADIDPVAVSYARRNLPAERVFEGDLYAALPPSLSGKVDLLVANVPYVPTEAIAEMPPEARDHEPRAALDGGVDGLDVLRRVAASAPGWLAPGGHLLIETGEAQAPLAVDAFTRAGLTSRVASSEELYATIVIGTYEPAGAQA
jgi:release factor glutamine methyltransferase